jgi:hypothetical protein
MHSRPPHLPHLPARSGVVGLMKRLFCGLILLACAGAQAHDTWFEPLSRNARGEVALALGTGAQFPQHDVGIGPELIQQSGCSSDGKAEPTRLRSLREEVRSHSYRAATGATVEQGLHCWMQMHPIELAVSDENAALYLKEIGASAELRARWEAMRARGVKWQERYVKTARIEWVGSSGAVSTQSVSTAMDVLMTASRQPLRAGDEVTFQVLRDGQPLAGLPVELRSDVSPIGIWRNTDTQGRITVKLPLAAKWMLRGTDLRSAAHNADFWESRFVTLTFDVVSP